VREPLVPSVYVKPWPPSETEVYSLSCPDPMVTRSKQPGYAVFLIDISSSPNKVALTRSKSRNNSSPNNPSNSSLTSCPAFHLFGDNGRT
jgi:hypothetical protein